MKKVLITGVSSGIGKALTKKLIEQDYTVWGLARRKTLLKQLQQEVDNNPKFIFSSLDISKKNSWSKLLSQMKKKRFKPNIVVFNAAIYLNDLDDVINFKLTEKVMKTNFQTIIQGVSMLLPYLNSNAQYIVISSLSAFKGNANEGIGYASSKAAISLAFEALHQKYKNTGRVFTTVYFGLVKTPMKRLRKDPPFTLFPDKAAGYIIRSIKERKDQYYFPLILFLFIKIMRIILPNTILFKLFSIAENKYK